MPSLPEPLVGSPNQARQVSLDIFDVVELGCERVRDVDDNDLPVRLALVEESHDTEDLDLLDLADVADALTDFADIERVVVTLGLGVGVRGVGVLPRLHHRAFSKKASRMTPKESTEQNRTPPGSAAVSQTKPCTRLTCGNAP